MVVELASLVARHEVDNAAAAQAARALAALLAEAQTRRAAADPFVLHATRLCQALLGAAGSEDRVRSRS